MKSHLESFVGVIDSGVGGLTVLKQLQSHSLCSYVYLADGAYCPYGTKKPSDVFLRVTELIHFLQNNGAKAVVIACNTASVHADSLRQRFSLPIYDVITPTCKRVVNTTTSKKVALLATNATVESLVYQRKLNAHDISVVSFACSRLVTFVEANEIETPSCEAAVKSLLFGLPRCDVDTVILGCTHFPILREKIAPYANGAKIVECCTDFPPICSGVECQDTVYLTTGSESQANNAAKWFGNVSFTRVDI